MEPTPVELSSIVDMTSAARWAKLDSTILEPLLKALGNPEDLGDLAYIPESDFVQTVDALKVLDAWLSPVDKGRALRVRVAAVCKLRPAPQPAGTSPQGTPGKEASSGLAGRKVKLSG